MTTRLLPHDEWHRLDGTDLSEGLSLLNPDHVDVLVVEDDGVIVAHWLLASMLHVEGLWIAPEARKSGVVARRLWRGMRETVAKRGASSVLTGAVTDDVKALLDHAGAMPLPDQFVLPMGER
jgi:hypothetical protein